MKRKRINNMEISNLNYFFYKEYYDDISDGISDDKFKKYDEYIEKIKFNDEIKRNIDFTDYSFELQTQYPGLLIGLGIPHDVKAQASNEIKDDIDLGFTLDYVSGLPYIPGSTVKGKLRSAFRNYQEFLLELIKEKYKGFFECKLKLSEKEEKDLLKKLEYKIFGEWCKDENYEKLPLSKRDIFFDAFITSDNNGEILEIDYITPHKAKDESMDELVEPTPIKMLRVKQDVRFKFRFKLRDTELNISIDGEAEQKITITAADKLDIFKQLLIYLGIGAKTNTGYGYMLEV